jgi:hypothetical protein
MLARATAAHLVLGYAAPQGPAQGGGSLTVSGSALAEPLTVPLGLGSGWRQVAVPVRVALPGASLVPGPWTIAVADAEGTLAPGSRVVSARLELTEETPLGARP